jgi:hypothetical protein
MMSIAVASAFRPAGSARDHHLIATVDDAVAAAAQQQVAHAQLLDAQRTAGHAGGNRHPRALERGPRWWWSRRRAHLRPPLLLQLRLHDRVYEAVHVAAEDRDLAYQRGGDEGELSCGVREHGLETPVRCRDMLAS